MKKIEVKFTGGPSASFDGIRFESSDQDLAIRLNGELAGLGEAPGYSNPVLWKALKVAEATGGQVVDPGPDPEFNPATVY